MVDRIASGEPDQVGIVPVPITFWHRTRQALTSHHATVSSSASSPERFVRDYPGLGVGFRGDFGRAWLADPCSMMLQEGLHAARLFEDKRAQADRFARRQAKAALEQEAAQARSRKTARW
jgi:hypothetical protein